MEREKQEINTREKAQSKVFFFVLLFVLPNSSASFLSNVF
jgi:hypothetical protein